MSCVGNRQSLTAGGSFCLQAVLAFWGLLEQSCLFWMRFGANGGEVEDHFRHAEESWAFGAMST